MVVLPFFVVINFTKFKIINFLNRTEKDLTQLKHALRKYELDLGYEIRDPETKTYFESGSRGQESFGSPIRNTTSNIHFLLVPDCVLSAIGRLHHAVASLNILHQAHLLINQYSVCEFKYLKGVSHEIFDFKVFS